MVCASFYYSLLNVFVFLCVWKKSHTFERETQTQNIPEDLSMFWCSCTSIVYLYSVPYTYINIHIHNVFIHIHIYSHHSDSFQSTSPFHSLTDILSVLSHTKNPHSQHLVPYSAHLHICFCLFTQYPLNFPANQNIFSAGIHSQLYIDMNTVHCTWILKFVVMTHCTAYAKIRLSMYKVKTEVMEWKIKTNKEPCVYM